MPPLQKNNQIIEKAPCRIKSQHFFHLRFEWLLSLFQFCQIKIPRDSEEKRDADSRNHVCREKPQRGIELFQRPRMNGHNKDRANVSKYINRAVSIHFRFPFPKTYRADEESLSCGVRSKTAIFTIPDSMLRYSRFSFQSLANLIYCAQQ